MRRLTYGLVNIGLDAMEADLRWDPDLKGVHMIVGLSNFSWGTPKAKSAKILRRPYLTMGMEVGLDFALANPEKTPAPLPENHPMVAGLRHALQQGRTLDGEPLDASGYRQAEAIMDLCRVAQGDD